jgi:hypothetical protein
VKMVLTAEGFWFLLIRRAWQCEARSADSKL